MKFKIKEQVNRLIKCFTLLTIMSLLLVACKTTKNSAKELSYQGLEKALLWEITGNDLVKPSYLFGTIHIIESESYFLPEGTLTAIDATDEMVFEIDMDEMEDMSMAMGLLQKAFMNDGVKLSDLLTDEDYDLVAAHFKKMGLPMMMFERVKPMFLTAFAGDMNPGDLQSGSMKSYELEFTELARESNMEISGLESIEYQLSIFDSIPYQDQADMLVEGIKSGGGESDQMDEMVAIYKAQDVDGMQKMFMEEDGGLEGHEEVLVFKRNENWIPIMEEKMKMTSIFFAVGAGHLGGERGVIHLLRKAGYNLKPISH